MYSVEDRINEGYIVLKKINNILKTNIGIFHLDLGCGDGLRTEFLANRFSATKFLGVDEDKNIIKLALRRNRFRLYNLEFTTDYPQSEDFNYGNNNTATLHFSWHEDPLLLNETHKQLIKGGTVVIVDYDMKNISKQDFFNRFNTDRELLEIKRLGINECYNRHTINGLQECIEHAKKAGFKKTGIEKIGDFFIYTGLKL